MQFYWPQVNVTGSGPEHMDKLNISLSFFSFLTGKGMENTALFFGGYRVNQNQTGGFQFDAGDTLNATHLNVTEQMLFNNKSYLTESDLSNEDLLNECPDQLFVCKATTDALVADAVNESAVGEEEETTDLSNMDTTDVLYALCVFFTFTFSILKVSCCLPPPPLSPLPPPLQKAVSPSRSLSTLLTFFEITNASSVQRLSNPWVIHGRSGTMRPRTSSPTTGDQWFSAPCLGACRAPLHYGSTAPQWTRR